MRREIRAVCFALLAIVCLSLPASAADGGVYTLPALRLTVAWPAGWVRSPQAALDAMNLQRNANFRTAPEVSLEIARRQGTAYIRLRIASEQADTGDAATYRDALMADFSDMMTQLGSSVIIEPIELTLQGISFFGAKARADGYFWVYYVCQAEGMSHVIQCAYPETDRGELTEMLSLFMPYEAKAIGEE